MLIERAGCTKEAHDDAFYNKRAGISCLASVAGSHPEITSEGLPVILEYDSCPTFTASSASRACHIRIHYELDRYLFRRGLHPAYQHSFCCSKHTF